MFPSILTALLFAGSGICGRHAAVAFGSLRANALRLTLAAVLLAGAAWWTGPVDFSSRTAHRLLLSGVIGFGLGDVGLFLAYPRLGSRLTLLVNLCSAPLFGAVADWGLTGARVGILQALAGMMILAGVALALGRRTAGWATGARGFGAGVMAALVAGLGQGSGAALTRWAKAAAREDGLHLSPLQEAFVRIGPGLAFGVAAWWLFERLPGRRLATVHGGGPGIPVAGFPWLVGASLFGPVLGVGAFQWALGTAPSAIVLSITATTPILIMPLTLWLERDRPSQAAVLGAVIAVMGVIWMGLLSA